MQHNFIDFNKFNKTYSTINYLGTTVIGTCIMADTF